MADEEKPDALNDVPGAELMPTRRLGIPNADPPAILGAKSGEQLAYTPTGYQFRPFKRVGWTTMHDLVQRCPACGHSVVWPFTDDYAMGATGPYQRARQAANQPEAKILRAMYPQLCDIYEIGTKIPTYKARGGQLWHYPCWLLQEVGMDMAQRMPIMQRLVNVLGQRP